MAVIGDEQIIEAVVIVISDSHGGGPAGALQPGFRRDIGEGAVAVVLVEPVRCSRWVALKTRAVENEQIKPTVIVVVYKRDATPDHLDDVALAFCGAVDYRLCQSRLLRNICEVRQKRTTGWLTARLRLDTT